MAENFQFGVNNSHEMYKVCKWSHLGWEQDASCIEFELWFKDQQRTKLSKYIVDVLFVVLNLDQFCKILSILD